MKLYATDIKCQSRFMAASKIVNPSDATLKELLGNGRRYSVPAYQRDYSWKEENWEDLWLDILDVESQPDGQHYMGTIVLQPTARESFVVIDGQQRITTLSILVLAAVGLLEEFALADVEQSNNRERARLLRDTFLGTKDPGSLREASKLQLNRNDDAFYQGTILQLKLPLAPGKLIPSNALLWNAYRYLKEKLRDKFQTAASGEDLATFINSVVGVRLLFLRVMVEDELSAYTVFETLNARGVELTASDLLKNYLMALVARRDPNALRHVLDQWERIVQAVGPRILPEFLRHFLNSQQKPYVRQERLFKTIKKRIVDGERVFNLLEELEAASIWYQALSDETDPQWASMPDAREHVRVLNLFAVKQFSPLLLAVARRLPPAQIEQTLRLCAVVSFRYNVICDRNTNDLEKVYNEAAVDVHEGRISTIAQIRQVLRSVALPDDDFRDAFSRKVLAANGRSKRVVRYILCALERQLGNRDAFDETTSATIEHILPESLSSAWESNFPPDGHARYVNRLGNYTLLEPSLNRECEQKPFVEKLPLFHASSYLLSQRITGADWTPASIDSRQQQMAGWAGTVWGF